MQKRWQKPQMLTLIRCLPRNILVHCHYHVRRDIVSLFWTMNYNPNENTGYEDSKSLGLDELPPEQLLDIVEQISVPLAVQFNVSSKELILYTERSKHHTFI